MQKRLLIALLAVFVLVFVPNVALAGLPPVTVDSISYNITCEDFSISWSHSSGTVTQVTLESPDHLYYSQYRSGAAGTLQLNLNPALSVNEAFMIEVWIGDGTTASPGGMVASSQIFGHITSDCSPKSNEWVSVCDDGRLNAVCSPIAVYPLVSDDGTGWSIYEVAPESEVGQQVIYISAEDFAALPETPEHNCTISSSEDGRIVVYLLTTGQFQINMGPDEDYKTFVYVFSDLVSAPVQIYDYFGGGKPEILPSC